MTKVLDVVLILIFNFLLNVEVKGSVWRHTIIPLSAPTPQKSDKLYSQGSKQPNWAKIIFMKNLLELECLRDNFKRIQRDRQTNDSKSQIPIYIEKEHVGRPIFGTNENENLQRKKYSGENEKIILTPTKQRDSGFPIYIYYKPQSLRPKQFKHLNKDLPIQKTNPKPKLNETVKENSKDESFKSASEEPIIGNKEEIKSKKPTLLSSEENKINNQVFDGSLKNRLKVSSAKVPIKNLLPIDKFLQFMETIQSLSPTYVKNASTGSQKLNFHTVNENDQKNIRKEMGKEYLSTTVKKPQNTAGGYHLSSEIPNKPKRQEPMEMLQNSIHQILKSLLGQKENETPKNHIDGNFNKASKVQPGFSPNKIAYLQDAKNLNQQKLLGKNVQPYTFDYPERRRYINEVQTKTEQQFYPETFSDSVQNPSHQREQQHQIFSVSGDTFEIDEPMPDGQKLTEPERRAKTTTSSPMTFIPKNYFSNNIPPNHQLHSKAKGRQLKYPEIAPYSFDASNIPKKLSPKPKEDVSQKWTISATTLFDQNTEPQETTMPDSISPDNKASTNVFQKDFISTFQSLAPEELIPSTSEVPIYMETIPSSVPSETILNLQTTAKFEVEGNQNTETSTIATTTLTPKEYTKGPMAFDLLITTHAEPDLKNQENSKEDWKNNEKMNLNSDLEMPEIANSLFKSTEQRRSDILINDAPDDYDQSQLEMESFRYMKKLKEILLTSDFTIDDIIFIVPWVVDDLRQNKIQPDDLKFLSKAFGKYWQDILTLSKDANLDVLPLMKVAKEKDLKKLLENFVPKKHSEKTTAKNAIEITQNKMVDAPGYDYLEEYQDFYENMVGQTSEKRKQKRLRSKREKSLASLLTDLMSDMKENNRRTMRIQKDAEEDMLKIEATKEYFQALEEENLQMQNEDRNYIYEDIIYDELSEILESSDLSVAESKKLSNVLLKESLHGTKK